VSAQSGCAGNQDEHETEFSAIVSVSRKLGIGSPETLRKWIRRAEIDAGQRPGMTTEESEQIKAFEAENAELRRANEILKSASAFFAAELDAHVGIDRHTSAATVNNTGRADLQSAFRARMSDCPVNVLRHVRGRRRKEAPRRAAPQRHRYRTEASSGRRRLAPAPCATASAATATTWPACTVERLMAQQGIHGWCAPAGRRAPPPPTRKPPPSRPRDRHFAAFTPNQLWVADFTYCRPGPDGLRRLRVRRILPPNSGPGGQPPQ